MMLPVSWQMGCDLVFARAMFCSMILNALSAIVPFLSRRGLQDGLVDILRNFRGGAADEFEQRILQQVHAAYMP